MFPNLTLRKSSIDVQVIFLANFIVNHFYDIFIDNSIYILLNHKKKDALGLLNVISILLLLYFQPDFINYLFSLISCYSLGNAEYHSI